MALISYISNHAELAVAELAPNFQGKPRLTELLKKIVQANPLPENDPCIQGLEKAAHDIIYKLLLTQTGELGEKAEGAQLDMWGLILGLKRIGGQSDDVYRRELASQFLFITSNGAPETLIGIVRLYFAPTWIWLKEYFPGHVIITFNAGDVSLLEPTRFFRRLENSAIGGVSLLAITVPVSGWFEFSSAEYTDTAEIDSNHGFSDNSQISGGKLGAVVE